MKHIKLKFVAIFLIMAMAYACQPRIKMDFGQWGDHAYLDNVQLFRLNVNDSAHLAEYYMYGTSVAGVQQIVISQGNAVIDSSNFSVTVQLLAGNSLESAGLLFYFHGVLIKPLNGSPPAGVIANLNKGPLNYRIYSADGSHHDWTVKINQ